MQEQLDQIERESLSTLEALSDEEALQGWKVAHLGRSSPLMKVFDQLGGLPKEQRPVIGRRANEIKRALEAAYGEKGEALRQASVERALLSERLDVTLPGRPIPGGRLHISGITRSAAS